MTTNWKLWMEEIARGSLNLHREWNEHFYGGKPLSWCSEPEMFRGVDRTGSDKRLLLVCVETGRVLAACVNPDALCAATRLLGDKC